MEPDDEINDHLILVIAAHDGDMAGGLVEERETVWWRCVFRRGKKVIIKLCRHGSQGSTLCVCVCVCTISIG